MVERVYSDGGTTTHDSSPNLNSDTYGGYIAGILCEEREKNTSVNETAAGFYKEIINSFEASIVRTLWCLELLQSRKK